MVIIDKPADRFGVSFFTPLFMAGRNPRPTALNNMEANLGKRKLNMKMQQNRRWAAKRREAIRAERAKQEAKKKKLIATI